MKACLMEGTPLVPCSDAVRLAHLPATCRLGQVLSHSSAGGSVAQRDSFTLPHAIINIHFQMDTSRKTSVIPPGVYLESYGEVTQTWEKMGHATRGPIFCLLSTTRE